MSDIERAISISKKYEGFLNVGFDADGKGLIKKSSWSFEDVLDKLYCIGNERNKLVHEESVDSFLILHFVYLCFARKPSDL